MALLIPRVGLASAAGSTLLLPGAGIVAFPSEAADVSVAPTVGTLRLVGQQPSATVSSSGVVTPAVGTLRVLGQQPTIGKTESAAPAAGTLRLIGNAPSVSLGGLDQTASPSAGTLRLVGKVSAAITVPVLIDALSTETGWTSERGVSGAWTAHTDAAADITRQGPTGTGWVGLRTGTQNYSGVTGTGARITKTITAVDLSNKKNVGVWYALDSGTNAASNPARLYNIVLYLGSDGDGSFNNAVSSTFELGVDTSETASIGDGAMNHAIRDVATDFTAYAGSFDWTNVQDIRIAVYGSNGTALAAAGASDVLVYFQGLYANLWTKPVVVFEHDDSLSGVYTYGRSRYATKGWLTTQFVIPGDLGGAGVMTEAQVADLYADGHDVSLHATYTGATLNTLTGAQIDTDLANGLAWLDSNAYNRSRHITSWPQGVVADSSGTRVYDRFVDQGVTVARGSRRWYNSVSQGAWSAWDRTNAGKNIKSMALKLIDISFNRLPDDYLTPALNRVVKYGGVLVINVHNIVASGASGNSINLADFEHALDVVQGYETAGLVTVKPLSQLFPSKTVLAATGTLRFVGQQPTVFVAGAWTFDESVRPNSVSLSGLTGAATDIDDDPDSPDGNWLVAA